MNRRDFIRGIALGATVIASSPNADAQKPAITTEEMMVPSWDPGIQLYVRNKRAADLTAFKPERTILYVHGATYPAETAFDLQVGGMSWMDYIAACGFDVYLLDIRGYGRSTRPTEMNESPDKNSPIVRTDTVVKEQILENDRRVRAIARQNELGRRLMEVPGVGPLLASAFIATIADPTAFRTGRDLAAWIGLVPKQNSSGGKERLGSITKAGNRYLRQMLVVGAMAVIRYAERHGSRRPWLVQLMQRRSKKVAAVALANKIARTIWALMTSGERYRDPTIAGALAA